MDESRKISRKVKGKVLNSRVVPACVFGLEIKGDVQLTERQQCKL